MRNIINKLRPGLPIFTMIAIFGAIPVMLSDGILTLILLGIQVTALIIQLTIVLTDE